jgi:hypothetical protein
MKNRLTKSQLEKLVREQLTEETRQKLDEGFLDSLKYAFAKVGSATAGTGVGKYINPKAAKKTAAAKEKLQKALDKEGAERVKKFIDELAGDYENFEEFPNMKDPIEFQAILANFMAFYDSLKAATDKYEAGKGPEEQPEGAIHTDIANEYVELLHKYLLNKQEVIEDVYKKVNESDEGETIEEVLAEVDWEKEAQKIADEEDDTAYGKEASTIKDLKSNKASIALGIAGLGSLAIGAKLIAMGATENTASTFLTDPGKITEVPGATEQYADSLVDSQGRGFLRTFRDAAAATGNQPLDNIDFSENVDTLARVYGQDPKEILLQGMQDLGREEFRGVSGEMAQQLYDFDKMGGNLNTVITKGPVPQDFIKFVTDNGGSQELIGTLGTTTASGAVPDAGVTILGMEPGGAVSTMAGKVLTAAFKKVIKTGAVTMVGKTALGGTVLAALGATLVPLGIGLIASAAAVKLARMKGLKSSRLATLQTVRDYIKKLKPKDPVVDPQPEEGGEEGPGSPEEGPFPVVEESDNICKTMVSAMRAYKFKVGDTFDFQTQRGEQKTAMVVSAEGMPSIEDTYNTGELEFSSYQHDYESDCAKNNGRFVRLPQVIVFNQGDVQRDIAEKKTRATNQAEQMSGIQVGVRVVKKGENAFATMRKAAGQKLGLEPTGALPEGHVIQFNVGNIQRSDENFESFMKKYVSALRGEDKEQRAKAFMDVLAPELRKRRGSSGEEPTADEPQADEPQADEPTVDEPVKDKEDSKKTKSGGSSKRSAMSGDDFMDSFFKKRSKGTSTRAGAGKSSRLGKRRRGYTKGAANENLQETLDRWAKIAGIIKESKND